MPRITVDVSDEINSMLEEICAINNWSKSSAAAWVIKYGIGKALDVTKKINSFKGGKKK